MVGLYILYTICMNNHQLQAILLINSLIFFLLAIVAFILLIKICDKNVYIKIIFVVKPNAKPFGHIRLCNI